LSWDSPDARARDERARKAAQVEYVRPLMLEAGAGTGKTMTLVARVLAWVLGQGWVRAERVLRARAHPRGEVEPDRIAARVMSGVVAITFTEAAASEMAERVGRSLAAVESGKTPIGLDLALLGLDEPQRRARASALLGALDQLVIRTIHAFCRRLLATFPLEAGLHPRFEVDADGEALRALCRELLERRLREVYGDRGDPDYLALAALGQGPQEIADSLEKLALTAMPAAALERDPLGTEVRGWLYARLQTHAELLRDVVAPRLEGGRKDRLRAALSAVEGLDQLCARMAAARDPALDSVAAWVEETLPESGRKRIEAWARGSFLKTEAEHLEHVDKEVHKEAARLHRLIQHIARLQPDLLELGRRVMRPLLAELERELRSRGIETFAALLRDARDLLLRRPDVALRVRADIDQLLVDEFQDTDRVQCELVRLLALEGPEDSRPGLFLVGDPKQSIYGWRSADLRAYDDFRKLVLDHGGQVHALVVNYRSAPAILEEVSRVHHKVMHPVDGLQPPFEPLVPGEKTRDLTGFSCEPWAPVEYWLTWTEGAPGEGPARRTVAAEGITRECEALARDLLRLHREQGLGWSDAAVLLRGTGELDSLLQAFRDAGIPYAVERDKNYYRRREIIDAAAFVRCILDPNDHLALLTVLRSPVVGVPDAALIGLWAAGLPGRMSELDAPDPARLEALFQAISDAVRELPRDIPGLDAVSGWDQGLRATLVGIAELREALEHLPADLWVERIRGRFLLEATEAARYQGAYRLTNLERFFRVLIEALERDGGDPQALLRTLRQSVAEAREAEEGRPKETAGDAVQVMTIHKSKGLEFQHVYVLQTGRRPGSPRGRTPTAAAVGDYDPNLPALGGEVWEYRLFGAPTLGWDRIEEWTELVTRYERVRTLYVAMTRARERLVLSGDLPRAAPELDQCATHADLLARRGMPPLPERMAELRQTRDGDRVVEADATWTWLALQSGGLDPLTQRRSRGGELPGPDEVARQQRHLLAARAEGDARQRRPIGALARPESPELLRATVAERRFSEDRAGDEGLGAGGGDPLKLDERLALSVLSALHRVLETLDLAEPAEEGLRRQRGRLRGYLRALVGPDDLERVEERASELLDRLEEGGLVERLIGLGPRVIARELPLLLPASAAPAGGEDRPLGYLSASVDLLYRAVDGGLVVVDYRVEPAPGPEILASAAAVEAPLLDALEASLGQRPALELWFLQTGDVARAA